MSHPIVEKLSSARAVSLLMLTAALCVLAFRDAAWRECFTMAIGTLIGNYAGRSFEAPKPQP